VGRAVGVAVVVVDTATMSITKKAMEVVLLAWYAYTTATMSVKFS
jgi:hypothetical protein